MAFQMSVSKSVSYQTTPLVYPTAYWVASFTTLNLVTKTATVVFSAYANKAAREAGTVQPVATHSFTVTGAEFTKWFSTAAVSAAEKNVYAQAYDMAKVTPDPLPRVAVPVSPTPTPKIFFAKATSV